MEIADIVGTARCMFVSGACVLLGALILFTLYVRNRHKEDWTAFNERQQLDEHGRWLPREYALRLSWFEKNKREQMSRGEAVKVEHPDFDMRSPNYINADSIAGNDFWRRLNIDYYKVFPELAEEHGWDMERMQYKNRE